ncbi:uncharacterized protein LOC114931404, partial [Nylanderia fulva]|uniref:uncharacterized protein LOC114931404 n=1 Tax=Nylanderia fulva TaxID=613905 RepID=UPI0010FBAC1A
NLEQEPRGEAARYQSTSNINELGIDGSLFRTSGVFNIVSTPRQDPPSQRNEGESYTTKEVSPSRRANLEKKTSKHVRLHIETEGKLLKRLSHDRIELISIINLNVIRVSANVDLQVSGLLELLEDSFFYNLDCDSPDLEGNVKMTGKTKSLILFALLLLSILSVADSQSLIYNKFRIRMQKLCSRQLSDALALVCRTRGYNGPFSYSNEDESTVDSSGSILEDCCYNQCSIKQLEQYCNPLPEEEDAT